MHLSDRPFQVQRPQHMADSMVGIMACKAGPELDVNSAAGGVDWDCQALL